MPTSSPGNYIETEVMTAPPQKLQLMLIEAAIRFSKRAKLHWEDSDDEQACEALIRAKRIISELLGGLNREASPKLTGKIASVYVYVFRTLMEASLEHNADKIDDAVRVLEVEQETWRQVCQKLAAEKSPQSGPPAPAPIAIESETFDTTSDAEPTAGFSFEA